MVSFTAVVSELDLYQNQPQTHQPLHRTKVDCSFAFETANEVAEIALKYGNHRMICDQTGCVQPGRARHAATKPKPTPSSARDNGSTECGMPQSHNLTISQSHTPAIQSLAELRKQPRHTGLSPGREHQTPRTLGSRPSGPGSKLTPLGVWYAKCPFCFGSRDTDNESVHIGNHIMPRR